MKIPCKVCGKLQERKRNPPRGCICKECQKIRKRNYQKAYQKTEKYKAYQKAYQQTKKSKAYHRAYNIHHRKRWSPANDKAVFEKAKELGFSDETAHALVVDGEVLDNRMKELSK